MHDFAPITTARLRLELLEPNALRALLDHDEARAGAMQGRSVSDLFGGGDAGFLKLQLDRMTARPAARGWCVRLIVQVSDGSVVGTCGFHGPPEVVGRAEVGYSILPSFRRQGYGAESVLGLVTWAREQGEGVVFAAVAPDNVASLKLVAKLGFRRTVVQAEDGDRPERVFELRL